MVCRNSTVEACRVWKACQVLPVTRRLLNMTDILRDWEVLRPRDDELLLQRGGTLVMRGPERVWLHTDKGILGYADVDEVVRVAKAA